MTGKENQGCDQSADTWAIISGQLISVCFDQNWNAVPESPHLWSLGRLVYGGRWGERWALLPGLLPPASLWLRATWDNEEAGCWLPLGFALTFLTSSFLVTHQLLMEADTLRGQEFGAN